MEFRVLIAGSRNFDNYKLLKEELDYMLSNKIKENYDIIIISGAARGADKLGERYAKERNYKIESYPANWDKYGKQAGYIRNTEMAQVSDVCIIFWDQVSPGSKHMYDICIKNKIPVELIKY